MSNNLINVIRKLTFQKGNDVVAHSWHRLWHSCLCQWNAWPSCQTTALICQSRYAVFALTKQSRIADMLGCEHSRLFFFKIWIFLPQSTGCAPNRLGNRL